MDATPSNNPRPTLDTESGLISPVARVISRRAMLFGGTGLVVAPWVLAACGSGSSNAEGSSSPAVAGGATTSSAAAGSPAAVSGSSAAAGSGGTLRIARPPASLRVKVV